MRDSMSSRAWWATQLQKQASVAAEWSAAALPSAGLESCCHLPSGIVVCVRYVEQ